MLKDVEIASRLARAYGIRFAATEVARDSLLEEVKQGRSNYDYSSMIRVFFPDGPPGTEPDATAEEQEFTGWDREAEPSAAPEAEVNVEAAPAVEEKADEEVMAEPVPETGTETEAANSTELPPPETEEKKSEPVEEEATPPEPVTLAEKTEPAREEVEEAGARRGFLSRMFGKGADD